MQYAIELYFDKETEKRLLDLAHKIADRKISRKFLDWKTRPHLTLACFNDVEEGQCVQALRCFAQSHKVQPAALASVSMFPDTRTVFLAPVMNFALYQFQRELHEAMSAFDAKGWEWYHPDGWVPHCTIALTREDGPEAFFQASDLVLREFRKMMGEFTSVGLVRVEFPVKEIFTAELSR